MPNAKKLVIPAVMAAFAFAVTPLPNAHADNTAAGKKAEKSEHKKKTRSSCAFRRMIDGYSVIDDSHFVLESGFHKYFLVTLTPGCHRLDFGIAIAITSPPVAGLCVERGDRVLVDHDYSCLIRDIEGVEDKKAAEKLVAERKKAAEEKRKKKDGKSG